MNPRVFLDAPGWEFDIAEVSANIFVVRGEDNQGRSVELTGTDPDILIKEAHDAARKIIDENSNSQLHIDEKSVNEQVLKWASKYNLTLHVEHRGCEVQCVDIVGSSGKRYQIWIDPPKRGEVQVHAWDYKNRRNDWDVAVSELNDALEEAIFQTVDWRKVDS